MEPHQQLRERVTEPPAAEYWEKRRAAGWRLVAVEWERGAGRGEEHLQEVPYGLRIAADCVHLQEDPDEAAVLRRLLELFAADLPLSQVVVALNREGHRTRAGAPWAQLDIFELFPRLIDAAPELRLRYGNEWLASAAR